MEEKIGSLVDALTKLVEKLDDKSTNEVVSDGRLSNPQDDFHDPVKDKEKEFKKQAEIHGKERKKQDKKKKDPRKILKTVMPVNIIDIDKKALKKLASIMPTGTKVKKKMQEEEKPKTGMLDFLKNVGLGILAGVLAPVVAFIAMFSEIGKQKWFLTLSKFIKESKAGKAIAQALTTIKKAFMSLGTRFPKLGAMVGKLFGKSGFITGIFSKIGTLGKTVFDLVKSTKIGSIAGKIGKFAGKIFAPVMILWGVIETVMGAVKGYKEDGVAGSIKGGVNALFDFLVVDLVNLIVSIPAWFLKKIGLKNVGKALQDNVAGVMQSIKDMFGGIVDTVVGVLTLDPKRIVKGLKGLWEGQKDFVGFIIGLAVDPVVNFLVKDVFKWGDPESPFSFKKDVLDPAVNKIKRWFKGLLALGDTEDGGWSLTAFINGVEAKVIKFFTDIFAWGEVTDEEGKKTGEWSLGTFIGTIAEKVKVWLTDLFAWADPTDVVFSLVDKAKEVWGKVKAWFTGLIAWAETDVDEKGQKDGFIITKVKDVIKSVKRFFTSLFAIPTDWGAVTDEQGNKTGEWSLATLVGTIAEKAKEWLVGLFTWVVPSGIAFSLVDKAKEIWGKVKAWFTGLLTWAETDKNEKGEKDGFIISTVKDVIKNVKEYFKKLFTFDDTESSITSVINIKTWLPNLVVSGLGSVSAWFLKLFGFDEQAKDVKDWTNKFSIGDLVVGAVKKVWEWFKGRFPDAAAYITKKWNDLTKNVSDIGTWIWGKVEKIWDWIKLLWNDPKKTIEDSWANITKNVASIGDWLWGKVLPIWNWIKDLWNDPKKTIEDSWNNITKNVAVIGDWLWGKVLPIWNWIKDLWNDPKKTIEDAWNNITKNVTSIGSWLWNKVSKVWEWLSDMWGSPGETIKEAWKDATDGMTNLGTWMGSKLKGAWKTISDTFTNLGNAIHEALPIWMQNPGKWMRQKFAPIVDFFHNLFDMESHVLSLKKMIRAQLADMVGSIPGGTKLLDKMLGSKVSLNKQQANIDTKRANRASERQTMSYASEIFGEGASASLAKIGRGAEWYEIRKEHGNGKASSWGVEQRELAQTEAMNLVLGKYGLPADLAKGPIMARNKVMEEVQKVADDLRTSNTNADQYAAEAMDTWLKNVSTAVEQQRVVAEKLAAEQKQKREPQIQGDSQRMRDLDAAFFGTGSTTAEDTKQLDDFIWRPGQPVKRFNKGDLVMGVHEQSARNVFEQSLDKKRYTTADNTTQKEQQLLAKKVDRMVEIMTENSETHKKTLEVLEQHGLIDKQGDTVVNNGGNSTVVNNMSIESDIMSFRDRVVGRLNTK